MYITEDYEYLNSQDKRFVELGLAKLGVHSLNFDRHYTDIQKIDNREFAEKYGNTSTEWSERCEKETKRFHDLACSFLQVLGEKYSMHQYNSHNYHDDWDMFYYSNTGWNGKDYFDFFSLSFDYERRTFQQNMDMIQEIKQIGMQFNDFLGCRVQYKAIYDSKKAKEIVKNNVHKILNKMIYCNGYDGKIKWVECNNEYGFFKKGAKKKYWCMSNEELLLILYDNGYIGYENLQKGA